MKTALFLFMMALTSVIQRPEILSLEAFREVYDNTQIHKEDVQDINTSQTGVIVVLGTWCSDSVEHVPVFMKMEDHLSFDFVDYFNVERGFQNDEGIVQDFNIERVPTFIVLRDGEEIGRIVETPEKSMIEDFKKICGTIKTQ